MFWTDPMTYGPPPRCCDDERELMMERAHRHLAEQLRRETRHRRRMLVLYAKGLLRALIGAGQTPSRARAGRPGSA